MMQQTSLQAYGELSNKKLSERQQAVYRAIIIYQPCTDKDIAFRLGWEINKVTPRRGELVNTDFVIPYKTIVQDGRKAVTWVTKNKMEMK